MAALLVGVGLVVAIGGATIGAGQRDALKFDAEKLLALARAATPFELKYPAAVPSGLALNNVTWGNSAPEDDPSAIEYYVDCWFLDAEGNRLHVWQTDLKDLGDQDPTRLPENSEEVIGGTRWSYHAPTGDQAQVYQFARRFSDGILVTVDYFADDDVLRGVVEALTDIGS